MSQIALVCIGLLRLTALDRALTDNLTSVQKTFELRVIELRRAELLKSSLLIKSLKDLP